MVVPITRCGPCDPREWSTRSAEIRSPGIAVLYSQAIGFTCERRFVLEAMVSKWRAKALELFPDMRADVQSAESVGGLWIELISRLESHYNSEPLATPGETSKLFRAICLYAIWCTRSDSLETQQAAEVEFYYSLPRFALQCPDLVYRRLTRELIANIGMTETEKMGGALKPGELKKFRADVRQAEDERQRRSQKR